MGNHNKLGQFVYFDTEALKNTMENKKMKIVDVARITPLCTATISKAVHGCRVMRQSAVHIAQRLGFRKGELFAKDKQDREVKLFEDKGKGGAR